MITYHGTKKLILTSRKVTSLESGAFRCNAQYVCRNTDNLEFIDQLIRGSRMPQLNIFTIGGEITCDIGSNGFTTFTVVGYAINARIDELSPLDTSQQKTYF